MEEIRDEGIILSQRAFGENEQIVKFFTFNSGLLSCFVRARQLKSNSMSLSCLELILRPSRGQLYKIREAHCLDYALDLRKSLKKIQFAGKMARAIGFSQAESKAAPKVYLSFKSYLSFLAKTEFEDAVLTSFYCKVLRHEGLLFQTLVCSECSKKLDGLYLLEGQSFCEEHKPQRRAQEFYFFSKKEREEVEILTF